MPYGLRVVSRVLLGFALVIPPTAVITLLTHGQFSHFVINDKQVSYDEFLRRGGFLVVFFIWIFSAVLAFGFLRAASWSRPLCFFPFVVMFVMVIWRRQTTLSAALYDFLVLGCEVAILVWYLFFRQTVKDYYGKTQQPTA